MTHKLTHLTDEVTGVSQGANRVAAERMFSAEELARRWNVSVRTIGRWRGRGLTSRPYRRNGKHVGYSESIVQRFEQRHPDLVRQGDRFSRMSEAEQQHIIRRAKEMLEGSLMTPTEITAMLAKDTQRSAPTVRKLLNRSGLLDETNHRGLEDRLGQRLYREFLRGRSIPALARQFGLPKSKVTLAVNRLRAAQLLGVELEYMPSEEFMKPGAERWIMGSLPPSSRPDRTPRKPNDVPAYIASLYDVPLLTPEQETHLFRQYNFLKYRVVQLRDQLDAKRPSGRLLDEIETLYSQALEVNRQLVRSNLRLVVAVGKKYVGSTGDLFEKISEGNMSLLRAVEKFDYTRGFKFSTYATWALKKNFIRSYATAIRQVNRFRTGHDELLDARITHRANPRIELEAQRHREQQVTEILNDLSARERDIIRSRFGLKPGVEPKTLQEVGYELGVSKERVRQLESRAMEKLRDAAVRAHLDEAMLDDHRSYQES